MFSGCGECVARIFYDKTQSHHSGFGMLSFERTASFDPVGPLALCGHVLDGSALTVMSDPNGELLSWNVRKTLELNQQSASQPLPQQTGADSQPLPVVPPPPTPAPSTQAAAATTTTATTVMSGQGSTFASTGAARRALTAPPDAGDPISSRPLEYRTVSHQFSQLNAYINGEKPRRRRKMHREPGEKLRRIRRKQS